MAGHATNNTRRRVGLVAVVITALVGVGTAAGGQPAPITRFSAFDSSSEGWFVSTGTNFSPADWNATGGQSGGGVSATFDPPAYGIFQSVPGSPGSTWAPGNAVSDYGGQLVADVSSTDPTTMVYLGFFSDNSSVLACANAGSIGEVGWAEGSVPLVTDNIPHLIDCVSGDLLTGPQLVAALAGFQSMFVAPGVTDDNSITVGLDNAQLMGPETPFPPPTGTIARRLKFRYAAGKFHGTLIASHDFSCAAKARVTIVRKGKKPVYIATVRTSAANLLRYGGPATFSFKPRRIVSGSYYATVATKTSARDGNTCTAVRSAAAFVP